MSEVLRAILTDASVNRRPVFYSAQPQASFSTVTGQKTFFRRIAKVKCKADCWFLALGAAQFASFNGSIQGWAGKAEATTWQIQRGSNLQNYSNFPQIKPNLNYNLNNFNSWDEYLLFKPNELIEVIEDVQITDQSLALEHITYVTLVGIEYRMAG